MTVLVILGLVAGCVLVGLAQWRLAQLAPVWPGAVIPVLWLAAAIALVVVGAISSFVDVAGLLLVGVVIARLWHDGRQKRSARSAPAAAGV